ncbi:hypothetical protein MMC07_000213 [Pseudocyphellaria aurata]|nr:hypothetical protein [Pseudocyphellaria aurata]
MHLSSLLPLALFTSLISAQVPPDQIPLRDENVRDEGPHAKACTFTLPSSYQQISSSAADTFFPQNDKFNVAQIIATPKPDYNTDTLLRFSGIPSGSSGCALTFFFRSKYPINSSGSTELHVYALSTPSITAKATYRTYYPKLGSGVPKGGSLNGNTTITTEKRVVISSLECKPSLDYLFQIASDKQNGSVSFTDAGNDVAGISGFYLSYNC